MLILFRALPSSWSGNNRFVIFVDDICNELHVHQQTSASEHPLANSLPALVAMSLMFVTHRMEYAKIFEKVTEEDTNSICVQRVGR